MNLDSQFDAHLASVASAFPSTRIDREAAVGALTRLFPRESPEFVANLVERSGVESRFLVPTLDEVLSASTFTSRNERYHDAAARLSFHACRTALARARLDASDVDVIVDVSCTGIAIPALDVALVPALGLRSDVLRIPITESGCAAGALALGLAATLARGGRRVLVVAVELCSLTLVRGDESRTNLIASVLFGDGAAAAVVLPSRAVSSGVDSSGVDSGGVLSSGVHSDVVGPRITAVGSHLIPDSRDTMGFHVGDHGLQIVLRRELPSVLIEHLPGAQRSFLARHGRSIDDVGLHLIHPGGRRVLEAYAQSNGLGDDELRYSRESLRRYGNLSSASILTVLELATADGARATKSGVAFAMGVGPGLSLEMLLLDWNAPSA